MNDSKTLELIIKLNNLVITNSYDNNYFQEIFNLIKQIYNATNITIIDNNKKSIQSSNNTIIITLNITNSLKILIETTTNPNPLLNELITSILTNIKKNMELTKKLKTEKNTDSTLKIQNRRAYDELISIPQTYKEVGVLFVDANSLGVINNMYGYQEGDKLLTTITNCLKNNFRYEDIYRIGGDEFAIICPNIKKTTFLNRIAQSKLELNSTGYNASYGFVYYQTTTNLSILVEEASIKMKMAKEDHRQKHPELYQNKYKVKSQQKIPKNFQN